MANNASPNASGRPLVRGLWLVSTFALIGAYAPPSSAQISSPRDAAIETYVARCLENGDEGVVSNAVDQWDSLLSMGYSTAQLLQLAEALPEDCAFLSFESAISTMAAEQGIEPEAAASSPQPVMAQIPAEVAEIETNESNETPSNPLPSAAGYAALVLRKSRGPLSGRVVAEDLDGLIVELSDGRRETVPRRDVASVVRLAEGEDPLRAIQEATATRTSPTADSIPSSEPIAGDRLLGFGFFYGIGAGFMGTLTAHPIQTTSDGPYLVHLDMDLPGFELRIHPSREFSINLLWHIGSTIFTAADTDHHFGIPVNSFLMTIFFHFHGPLLPTHNGDLTAFGIAPGLRIGRQEISASGSYAGTNSIGFATRIGGEVVTPTKDFGFGVYFRPAISATRIDGYSETIEGAELMVEFTWTFYAHVPEGS